MEWNKSNMKKLLAVVAFAVLLFVGLQNLPAVVAFFGFLFRLFFPFLLGLCIAFILNVPLRFVERLLFRRKPPSRVAKKLRRPVSLLVALLLVAGVVFIVLFLLIPEVGRTLQALANRIPPFIAGVQSWAADLIARHPEWADWLTSLEIDWNQIGTQAMGWLTDGTGLLLDSTFRAATSVFSGLVNFFLGLIFAIYVLMQKEKLGRQVKKVLYAYLPEKYADRAVAIGALSHKTFSSFLSGQCLEACILGLLFFIALTVFRFPYALMISVLTAFTALIPIFGAIIGCAVGAFCILIVDPMQALWFILLFQVIQQIEGNLIYPHVVGNSVNLPSMWVLVAVTVGGSTMGVAGMLLFIPLCSVLYAVFRETVGRRLKRRKVSPAKWETPVSGDAPSRPADPDVPTAESRGE
ncbi:MAG TPA: AI-2E family transporter [Firmicutes bacterium]|nr:AI-2E family transporter [Bacillota bacterium]